MADEKLIYILGDDDSWKPMDNKDEFVELVESDDFSAKGMEILVKDLPFYKDAHLIKVEDAVETEDSGKFFYIKFGEDYASLNGNVSVIHEVNEDIGIELDKDNVFDYLKFFCFFLTDEDGNNYFILENDQSEFLVGRSILDKKRWFRKFNGSEIKETKPDYFDITTRVLVGGYLYDARFEVKPDGNVEMQEDVMIGPI
tara:strand:+ start:22 stop:618 length:597 start_codon:yes stop_codon:yes gene_type:complete